MLSLRQTRANSIRCLFCVIMLLGAVTSCSSTRPSVARLPAEYAPIQALALSWPMPHRPLWPMYRAIVRQLRAAADVRLLVPDEPAEQQVRDYLGADDDGLNNVDFLHISTHSIWIRDYGPLFTQKPDGSGGLVAIDLRYVPLSRDPIGVDDPIPSALAPAVGVALADLPLILEGGNILADGQGSCFLSDSVRYRNHNYSYQEIQYFLRQQLGCETATILPVLAGEPTGHVGLYLKLADSQTALVAQCSSGGDRNCARLDAIAQEIGRVTTHSGERYHIVRVPYPWLGDTPAGRLYASYANGVIANGYAFVPQFGLPEDAAALQAYGTALPQLHIVGVDVAPLLRLGGALQCITLPIPVTRPLVAQG